jgi:hypothetical protein
MVGSIQLEMVCTQQFTKRCRWKRVIWIRRAQMYYDFVSKDICTKAIECARLAVALIQSAKGADSV